jgi:putative lipoic acid-binding regulatory protein
MMERAPARRIGASFSKERAMENRPDHRPSVELLESTHPFPGNYTIKAIGQADDDFEQRVVAAVASHLAAASDLDYTVRATKGGRHVAVTLDITVQNAEQVRAIYAGLHEVRGLTLLF